MAMDDILNVDGPQFSDVNVGSEHRPNTAHLVQGIVHDINNLLAVTFGNAEVLAEQVAQPRLREIARLIMQTASRSSEMIQLLLSDSPRKAFCPMPVPVDQAVTSFSDVLRRALGERIRLVLTLSDEECVASFDRRLFEAALLNLAINARDAMPDGGELEIATSHAIREEAQCPRPEGGRHWIRLSVRDTGIGMPDEVLRRALEPYFTTKGDNGTGLGLASVAALASHVGGWVDIDSTENKGTTVHVYFRSDDTVSSQVMSRLPPQSQEPGVRAGAGGDRGSGATA